MKAKTLVVLFCSCLVWQAHAAGQSPNTKGLVSDTLNKYAHKLIMKSLTSLTDNESYAIYFEGLASGVANPTQIFTLPSYKVVRGGYLFVDKGKFETKMGNIQGLSDGKLVVYVDQEEKMMLVDSVRTQPFIDGAPDEQLKLEETRSTRELLGADSIGEQNCSYLGTEKIKGKLCHKIRADFKGEVNAHYLYWVDAQSGKMVLMGEWTGGAYSAYWIKDITDTAPKGHDYSVSLPATKMTDFYGMEVIDNRFIKAESKKAFD